MLMIVPLTLLFINTNKKLDIFFLIWGIFSLLATAKGIMQNTLGVDYAERQWLNEGNASTHILFGKLRVFSFMSDAGQFGANQGYSAVVAIIIAFVQKKRWMKIFFIIVAVMGFYGMVISGTRGAISVPFAGLTAFFVLRKNTVALVSGAILIASFFIFFKYTYIGQGNAEIRRMRSIGDEVGGLAHLLGQGRQARGPGGLGVAGGGDGLRRPLQRLGGGGRGERFRFAFGGGLGGRAQRRDECFVRGLAGLRRGGGGRELLQGALESGVVRRRRGGDRLLRQSLRGGLGLGFPGLHRTHQILGAALADRSFAENLEVKRIVSNAWGNCEDRVQKSCPEFGGGFGAT